MNTNNSTSAVSEPEPTRDEMLARIRAATPEWAAAPDTDDWDLSLVAYESGDFSADPDVSAEISQLLVDGREMAHPSISVYTNLTGENIDIDINGAPYAPDVARRIAAQLLVAADKFDELFGTVNA